MAVRIGIALGLDPGRRLRPPRHYHTLETTYTRALVAAGAVPVLLPLGAPVRDLVDTVDGLLLPGGDDLPPPATQRDVLPLDPVPPAQLDFDRALLREARSRGLPVLGICYGMQLLALESGGRLHYHLPTDRPGAPPHRPEPPAEEALVHEVEVAPDSRLAGLLGITRLTVNSLHHQGVADAGRLRAVARAPDGLIEAVEAPGSRFEVGVQWHPEKLGGETSGRLFRGLAAACAESGEQSGPRSAPPRGNPRAGCPPAGR